jgi:3-oxoacyl-[acyl-carrier-protein] synthase-3
VKIGLRSVAAVLPPETRTLRQLQEDNRLISEVSSLEALGFEKIHVATGQYDAGWLALEAAQKALTTARLTPDEIDLVIWASALPDNHVRPQAIKPTSEMDQLLSRFNYNASWLQETLGLDRARVTGIAQQGCAGMFSALASAQAFLTADPRLRNVLCVGVDVLPPHAPREILYNLISDAACAVILSKEEVQCTWQAFHQVSKGYYWNIVEKQKEIIASYFPTSRIVIRELLSQARLEPQDMTWILPTGVSQSSWSILARLIGVKEEKIYRAPVSFGHTVAADNLLHLQSLIESGRARPGDKLMLFTYGFGSTWAGLILEMT